MTKVLAKQVEGAVDQTTSQEISGVKTFTAPVIHHPMGQDFFMVMYQGFVYWTIDPDQLHLEGNFRIGVEEGSFVMQFNDRGNWQDIY
jgi:hypothetical protein